MSEGRGGDTFGRRTQGGGAGFRSGRRGPCAGRPRIRTSKRTGRDRLEMRRSGWGMGALRPSTHIFGVRYIGIRSPKPSGNGPTRCSHGNARCRRTMRGRRRREGPQQRELRLPQALPHPWGGGVEAAKAQMGERRGAGPPTSVVGAPPPFPSQWVGARTRSGSPSPSRCRNAGCLGRRCEWGWACGRWAEEDEHRWRGWGG